MPEVVRPCVVELARQRFGCGGEAQIGEMAAELLIDRRLAHHSHLGDLRVDLEVDVGSRPTGPRSLAASASAASPGGRFAFLSHGRAVVNAESTAFSRAARCSTTAHERSRAVRRQRWVTRSAPEGATTSIVSAAEALADEQGRAAEPRRRRVTVAPIGDRRVVGDDPFDLDRRRERPPAGGRAAARHRRARGRSCVPSAKRRSAPRPSSRRTGRGSAGHPRGSCRPSSATTVPRRSAPRTRPIPCGCPAAAGTARRPPRSAWRPGRRWPGRRGFPA